MSQFDPFARYYDADYGEYDDDLLLYSQLAHRTDGQILEVMCGTGRVALPLARDGHRVVGIDVAPAMLEQARARARQEGVSRRVKFVEGDVRNFNLGRTFGLVIVAINSFMHLETADDQLAALRSMADHLGYTSLLAIDLFNPHVEHLERLDGSIVLDRSFRLPESGHLVQKFVARRADLASQTIEVTFLYDEIDAEGVVRRHVPPPFLMRWLYRHEAEHLLARAGLELEAIYGSYELEEYSGDSERMILLAHKK